MGRWPMLVGGVPNLCSRYGFCSNRTEYLNFRWNLASDNSLCGGGVLKQRARTGLFNFCVAVGFAAAASRLYAQESPQDIALDILFPVRIATAADTHCEEIQINSRALRVYLLQSEQRFIDIGENANLWLGVRYSERDFAPYYEIFSNTYALSAESSREEFCAAVLREIGERTSLNQLLFSDEEE